MKEGFNIYQEDRPSKITGRLVSGTVGTWDNNNKYLAPHQGKKEIARRARQIENGKLKVS